jgi:hypothetical protein
MVYTWLVYLADVFRVVHMMDTIEPVTKVNPHDVRFPIAAAIVSSTTDEEDRTLLVSIAKWESFFRTDVVNCQKKGGGVALGPWQVVPRTAQERKDLCSGDLLAGATLALSRIAESRKLCKSLPDPEKLSHYASGSCTNPQGKMLSRLRWKTAKDLQKMNIVEE